MKTDVPRALKSVCIAIAIICVAWFGANVTLCVWNPGHKDEGEGGNNLLLTLLLSMFTFLPQIFSATVMVAATIVAELYPAHPTRVLSLVTNIIFTLGWCIGNFAIVFSAIVNGKYTVNRSLCSGASRSVAYCNYIQAVGYFSCLLGGCQVVLLLWSVKSCWTFCRKDRARERCCFLPDTHTFLLVCTVIHVLGFVLWALGAVWTYSISGDNVPTDFMYLVTSEDLVLLFSAPFLVIIGYAAAAATALHALETRARKLYLASINIGLNSISLLSFGSFVVYDIRRLHDDMYSGGLNIWADLCVLFHCKNPSLLPPLSFSPCSGSGGRFWRLLGLFDPPDLCTAETIRTSGLAVLTGAALLSLLTAVHARSSLGATYHTAARDQSESGSTRTHTHRDIPAADLNSNQPLLDPWSVSET